ncbi:3'-5' exonuclease [Enterobacter hormaechei subsp. steigerwaltii]
MNNVMLDIRALGKAPDSPIFAIECVFFEPSTGKLGPQYYRAVDLRSVECIDPEAVLELLKGDAHQRAEVVSATCTELNAVAGLFSFIRENASLHTELNCWALGTGRVPSWLIHAARRHDLGHQFVAFKLRCLASLIMLAGATGYAPHPRRSTATYMLTDAAYQAEQACEIWQRLTSPHIESL